MGTLIDINGQTFGRLKVLGRSPSRNKHDRARWFCLCECGKEISVDGRNLVKGLTRSCSCLQKDIAKSKRGPDHQSWKGGRKYTSNGYVMIYCLGHPRCQTITEKRSKHGAQGYVLEHIVVMEGILQRHLLPFENVHHKNGVRDDNRPENLELWVTMQPAGQRPLDLVRWAKEILARYGASVEGQDNA